MAAKKPAETPTPEQLGFYHQSIEPHHLAPDRRQAEETRRDLAEQADKTRRALEDLAKARADRAEATAQRAVVGRMGAEAKKAKWAAKELKAKKLAKEIDDEANGLTQEETAREIRRRWGRTKNDKKPSEDWLIKLLSKQNQGDICL